MTRLGRFPENGALDRLDKRMSRPIFRLPLPAAAEFVVTMPGTWFGNPLYSQGLVPLLVASLSLQQDATSIVCTTLPAAVAGLGYWCKLCWESLTLGSGITKAYSILSRRWILALPNVAMGLLALGNCSEAGRSAAAHYISSWFCSQLFIEALKGITWRLRPVVVLADELDSVPRHFKELSLVVKQASQANLSFPSGDAAGGAIFATAVAMAAPRCQGIAITIAALCGFGRIYFHCHHLLDVVVGQFVGAGVTLILGRWTKPKWGHVLLSQFLLLGLWKPVQCLKPQDGAKQELENNSLTKDA